MTGFKPNQNFCLSFIIKCTGSTYLPINVPTRTIELKKVSANLQWVTPSGIILHQLPVLCFKNFLK